MRTFAVAFAFITVLAGLSAAQGSDIPPQAQASSLAVPDPTLKFTENSPVLIELPAPRYFVSALLVVHCRKVEALVMIDDKGEQHPYHGKEATLAQVMTILSTVSADKVAQVTVTCPGELGL